MKNNVFFFLLFISLSSNINATETGLPPCTNPFETIDWSHYEDDIIFGSYDGSSEFPLCTCMNDGGDILFGLKYRHPKFSAFIELQNVPYAFSCFDSDDESTSKQKLRASTHRESSNSDSSGGFRNARYITYPIFEYLNLIPYVGCSSEASNIGIPFISEIVDVWNNDFIAVVAYPEAVLYNTPLPQISCVIDCTVATSPYRAFDFMTWCSGCWGALKASTGNIDGANELVDAALLVHRVLSLEHRGGALKQTTPQSDFPGVLSDDGNEVACSPPYTVYVPKRQYMFNLAYPVPDEVIQLGQYPFMWTANNTDPMYQNKIFGVWQRTSCCFGLREE